jgi:hypothetical protein
MVTAIVPILTFAPIAAQTFGNAPFAVSATSASTGAVTYAVVSGSATVTGNMVTLTGPGTVMLSVSQAASGNYAGATATTSFTVAAAPGATVGFTLTTSAGSGVVTVLPGGATVFNLMLTPGSGATYPDALTLSATGFLQGDRGFLPGNHCGGQWADAGDNDRPDDQHADGAGSEAGRIAGGDGLGLAAAADGGRQAGTQEAAEDAGPAGGAGRSSVGPGCNGVPERLRRRWFLQSDRNPLHRGGNRNRYGYRCPTARPT